MRLQDKIRKIGLLACKACVQEYEDHRICCPASKVTQRALSLLGHAAKRITIVTGAFPKNKSSQCTVLGDCYISGRRNKRNWHQGVLCEGWIIDPSLPAWLRRTDCPIRNPPVFSPRPEWFDMSLPPHERLHWIRGGKQDIRISLNDEPVYLGKWSDSWRLAEAVATNFVCSQKSSCFWPHFKVW